MQYMVYFIRRKPGNGNERSNVHFIEADDFSKAHAHAELMRSSFSHVSPEYEYMIETIEAHGYRYNYEFKFGLWSD